MTTLKSSQNFKLSIVVPIYNEEEVLEQLYGRLKKVLNGNFNYEVIFINDDSRDASLEILKKINQEDNRYKIISFSRNFGHQIAVSAGLNFVNGDAIIVIDGDLQDPPELIPEFLEKWQEGYEVVYAVRKKRKEPFLLRMAYKTYYRILKMVAKINIPLDSGDFCLMDKKVVALLNSFPEKTRFVRGLRSWVGFRQIGMEYERDKRFAGETKYNFTRLLKLATDGVISFSDAPLKVATIFGFIISFFSICYGIYVVIDVIFNFNRRVPGWSSLVVGISFLGGIQLIVLGVIGEYLIRIFEEVKGRPLYIIDEAVGFNKNEHE